MPEAGLLPIPRKLARQGVKDMVRISDGRMSGTAAGTIVLHVTPESALGGPLALVQTGDRIRLSVSARRIDLLVDEAELARRIGKRPGHIWAWINRDHRVPAEMCKPIEHATGGAVKRHELRPDIFDPPHQQQPQEVQA